MDCPKREFKCRINSHLSRVSELLSWPPHYALLPLKVACRDDDDGSNGDEVASLEKSQLSQRVAKVFDLTVLFSDRVNAYGICEGSESTVRL